MGGSSKTFFVTAPAVKLETLGAAQIEIEETRKRSSNEA
jgi:hypothetical protein